ncbi:hypothetical protein JI721_01870 [Alicyclobacillus cycloheptanicus]|uniref:Divalent metal cation (Fe/Co/Zn/Cd) transporter n=1 Tax=Alicyclobacillus cycloheptanicus TaxID=1457 RepID=A0ABT9XGZ3_9BACL|nr:hypothetical protein [Alicyclobacillus cycloheptanicus]MDQ0189577.1 divalent metal cation (Fe/Co/Zn/Cd) transporter [Alicyclobacillus cycloheptanicus]WDM01630.1 hypothetical protein JI721_01870 [Alicyclobacillus cycloheptanicus]
MHQSSTIVVVVLLVVFGLYRRVRRQIGYQLLRRGALTFRAVLFAVVSVLLLVAGYKQPMVYVGDGIGIVLGLVLAYIAMRYTQFEQRGGQWYYRSNGWIGAIVIALFFGRLIYRFALLYNLEKSPAAGAGTSASLQAVSYTTDPWTAGVVFILFSYYVAYFWMVLRKEKELSAGALTARQSDPS